MLDEKLVLEKALKNDSTTAQSRFLELARRHFAMLESWLDKAAIGPTWLADMRIAGIVAEALHHRDGKRFRLDAYSIMPNHVHSRSGAFWEHESFDHYVRNRAEWLRIVKYVLENPVKAGLVHKWEDWPWNYVRDPLPEPNAN
jgi:putative transposase